MMHIDDPGIVGAVALAGALVMLLWVGCWPIVYECRRCGAAVPAKRANAHRDGCGEDTP